ncbi:unnamed protein product [Symbiodinium natans]|uniref:S-adenosyl-L-methionine-dependent methyltransferase n=1 Tax=Symbiodinium natans TaxID=878477 RepID=A0A812JZI6_9DINO|nr:unnamed protein product [Symbiodinium natans]
MPPRRYACAERMPEKASHAFTAKMCAGSRYMESQRPDALFVDPLASKLAGPQGLAQPMGDWIMVPRTRFGDDFVVQHYMGGTRQLVMLGAGMDARAYRLRLPDLKVFEVDLPILLQDKEPLLEGESLTVQSRTVVPTDFSSGEDWSWKLQNTDFDPTQPTVWLLEGLMMYLTDTEAAQTLRRIGGLSAPRSSLFFDAISASYVHQRIVVGGAPFLGGSDHYGALLQDLASFSRTQVWDFSSLRIDRRNRRLSKDWARSLEPTDLYGRNLVLFVESQKI